LINEFQLYTVGVLAAENLQQAQAELLYRQQKQLMRLSLTALVKTPSKGGFA